MSFELHANFADKIFVLDLPLCRVLLENNRFYPWVFLIPRRANVNKIMDLKAEDQLLLLQELDLAQRVIWNTFTPHQLNVAAIGNRTPQLHVHVIGRFHDDPAWPATVWDHPVKETYNQGLLQEVVSKLRSAF